jgi:hypothetical protein
VGLNAGSCGVGIRLSFGPKSDQKWTKLTKKPLKRSISAKIEAPFKLSSASHTAYPAIVGYAGLRGSAFRLFFDPAETT